MPKSRLFIVFLLSFVTGIFLGDLIKIDPAWLLGLIGGLTIALICLYKELKLRFVFLLLIGLFAGIAYLRFWDNRQTSIQLPLGREITFTSQIIAKPVFEGAKAQYLVKFEDKKIEINTGRFPELNYGDEIQVKGALKKSYDYIFYKGVSGQIYNAEITKIGNSGNIVLKIIYQISHRFENSLNQNLSEPMASFGAGLLLGSKRNIPDSLMSDFNRTGTTHIVAVSGYNVTIIIIYLGILFGLFSRKLRFWGTITAIIIFVIMTGAPASVIRAGILAGLISLGKFEGRRINMLILITLTAAVMLLFNPYALRHDLSFELSFLAFLGLVYLGPIIANLKFIKILPKFLNSTLSETLGAQILVLPILIYAFGRVSLVSPLVNILILWIIPLAMLLVFLVGILGIIWFQLSYLMSFLAWLVLKYIIVVVETFSRISWASLNFTSSGWWWMMVFYVLIGLVIIKNRKLSQKYDEKF